MAFDYKKEYREYYLPKKKPSIVTIPPMYFASVCGQGDPNEENGAYKEAISKLYAVAYTIKMSKKGTHHMEGYFDYVVPPLEGFWWQEGIGEIDFSDKAGFRWISVIRLPDFVTEEEFGWALNEAASKKQLNLSDVRFLRIDEGLCVQCLHTGPYDLERETIREMDAFARGMGYEPDFENGRHHHEIYLSDPKRTAPEKMKTVIRHPIRQKQD